MSRIKSFSVGNGDLFYIEHGSDNFPLLTATSPRIGMMSY